MSWQGEASVDEPLCRMWSEDEAEDLVEYALIALVIAVALIAALGALTNNISVALSEGVSALAQ